MEQASSPSPIPPLQRKLFIILGPSGAGKGTLLKAACAELPELHIVVPHTTRAPRTTEINAKHFHFISRSRFLVMIVLGRFVEWTTYPPNTRHAQFYGTSWKELRETPGIPVLEIELQGAQTIKKKVPGAQIILIEPPAIEALRERLGKRGTGTPEENEARVTQAIVELKEGQKIADYIIVNHTGETGQRKAGEELIAILQGAATHRSFDRHSAQK